MLVLWRIAEPEFTQGGFVQASRIQVVESISASRAFELCDEPVLCGAGHIDQFRALFRFPGRLRIGGGDFHPGLFRQLLDRIDE